MKDEINKWQEAKKILHAHHPFPDQKQALKMLPENEDWMK